jgi:hypothetical protein
MFFKINLVFYLLIIFKISLSIESELNRQVLESIYGFTLNLTRSLNLCCKKFTSIQNDTFLGLSLVENLVLASNSLTHLESSTFPKNFYTLIVLDLYTNEIVYIHSLAFKNLINLKSLRLYNNRLTSIERTIFSGLLKLEAVYLRSNPISSILPDYVKRLCSTNLKCTIYL